MITEQMFLSGLADVVLRVFEDPELCLTKDEVCTDGHFSPRMLTSNTLFRTYTSTFMRLMLYLAMLMNEDELQRLFHEMAAYISEVAERDDFSAYYIIDAHAGSPVGQSDLEELVLSES